MNDAIADGNANYTIVLAPAVSADANYSGTDATDIAATNLDDDVAGISVTPISGPTTEAGGQATFAVTLTSQPTADVTIAISSSNPAEGTASVSSLTFTAANWNLPQTVIVTGVDDAIADADVAYTIVLAPAVSGDPSYADMDAVDVSAVNLNDDVAGLLITPISGPTTEAGGQAMFAVVLTSQPTATVSIALQSSNPSEGVPTVTSITFTPANWSVAQVVTIAGVDDFATDGNVLYSIVNAAIVSADPSYSGMIPGDVSVVNVDNDAVAPTTGGSPGSVDPGTPGSVPPTNTTSPPIPIPSDPNPANQNPANQPQRPDESVQHQIEIQRSLITGNFGSEAAVPVLAPAPPPATAEIAPPTVVPEPTPIAPTTPSAPTAPAVALAPTPPPPMPLAPPSPAVSEPAQTASQRLVNQLTAQTSLFTEFLEPAQDGKAVFKQSFTAVLTTAFVVTAGYALISTRLASWLLMVLMARPVWKQMDPLEILYAWNEEQKRRKSGGEEDETLQTLVRKKAT